jgi:hypothetical protein
MCDVGLICPKCRADLVVGDAACACRSCGRSYAVIDGIPVLVVPDGEHARLQAWSFNHAVNAEWEIERPHGSPRFHGCLLAEKFRRTVANALAGPFGNKLAVQAVRETT